MKNGPEPLEMRMFLYSVQGNLPLPQKVLHSCSWTIDPYSAPFLAGCAPEEDHRDKFVICSSDKPARDSDELTVVFSDWSHPRMKLPRNAIVLPEAGCAKIIGDISSAVIEAPTTLLVFETANFSLAKELAGRMGYRSILAGEFLQALWWLQEAKAQHNGLFFCSAYRRDGYAIMAVFNHCQNPPLQNVVFDAYVGRQLKNAHVKTVLTPHCLFVPDLKDW
jgi:hypothetical protein